MRAIRKLVQKINKTMKGYSVGSVLERASYAKSTYEKRETSNRSIMELAVYNRTDNAKHNLWGKLVKRKSKETD